ncbi:Tyrosine-protein phosphatase non-receptor type 4 [Nibea albiflora]|uniref:Tyrosine-protein phosphatase non-receptor type 4 n=1 Tax=Nibea albiflora TaxID=240163 RepID=A0ACB7EF01_NIBAL|nr:Tyrosine-protein phosphatase non-receptor type 4 [Nibea albiflora]
MSARFRLPAGRSYNVRATELERDRQHTQVVCNVLLLDNTVKEFKVSRWLDPNKPIRKQLKRGSPHNLSFRVKFFVTDPNKLQEEYTRYQYFLQIKQDIFTGRLPCPHNTAALLASYAVQSELGDYSETEHPTGYLSEYCFISNPPQDFHKEVSKHHQQHSGLSPAQSEFNYLNTARTLELYGVELHYARDQSNTEILIGVMSAGIVVYKNRVRINYFPWLKIVKISFKCKQFFVQMRREATESRETLLGFNMVNYRACKNLWKACVEHHTFFRLERPIPPQKNFFAHYFTLGSKFRYCGRTEVQSVQYGKEKGIKDRVFARSPSKPLARKLLGGTDWESVSRNSLSDERLETQSLPTRSPPGTPNQNSLFVQEGTRLRPSSVGHLVDHVIHASPSLPVFSSNHKSASSTQANSISLDSTPSPEGVDNQPPALPPKQLSRKTLSQIIQAHSQQSLLDNHLNEMYDVPVNADKTTLNGVVPHDNLVLIKMRPDEHGRFGFNVKGGADQKMPIIVSRVAPGTSADLCVPRLNEGDQVVLINGRDISDHTHDQVVMFIKASCESHSGELILLVRPNAIYDVVEEKADSEPDFQYIPEKSPQDPAQLDQHALRDSMVTLKEGLSSGAILAQFDVRRIVYFRWLVSSNLYPCSHFVMLPLFSTCFSLSAYNLTSSLPSPPADDATRVILKSTDDYINANYINVKCHQYWPSPDSSATYGDFTVTCHNEEGNSAFLVREMTLVHTQSQYRFVCEAILKVYEEGLVKPLKTAIYQQREKVDEEGEHEEKKEQQKAGEGEEMAAMEEGEAAVAELLEEGLDEEDDDEEVEVLDVGEVTEEGGGGGG